MNSQRSLRRTSLAFDRIVPRIATTLAMVLISAAFAGGAGAAEEPDYHLPQCADVEARIAEAGRDASDRTLRRLQRMTEAQPSCGVLVARFARETLTDAARKREIVNDSLNRARQYATSSGEDYIAFLIEAVRAGLDRDLQSDRWGQDRWRHLQDLQNLISGARYQRLERQMLGDAQAVVDDPFGAASPCDRQMFDSSHPLIRELNGACQARKTLQDDCPSSTMEQLDAPGLERCSRTFEELRSKYRRAASLASLQQELDRAVAASNRRRVLAQCQFSRLRTGELARAIDGCVATLRLLQQRDLDALAGTLRGELSGLSGGSAGRDADVLAQQQVCDLSGKLNELRRLVGLREDAPCTRPDTKDVELERLATQFLSLLDGREDDRSLPGVARELGRVMGGGFDAACLGRSVGRGSRVKPAIADVRSRADAPAALESNSVPAKDYLRDCSASLKSVVERLAPPRRSVREAQRPQSRRPGEPVQFDVRDLIIGDGRLDAAGRRVPKAVDVITREAELILAFVNHRIATVDATVNCAPGASEGESLDWASRSDDRSKRLQDALNNVDVWRQGVAVLLQPSAKTAFDGWLRDARAISACPAVGRPITPPAPTPANIRRGFEDDDRGNRLDRAPTNGERCSERDAFTDTCRRWNEDLIVEGVRDIWQRIAEACARRGSGRDPTNDLRREIGDLRMVLEGVRSDDDESRRAVVRALKACESRP